MRVFFSLWLSHTFGGPELSFNEFARVIEALSCADGSAGWCAMVATVFSRLSGYLAEDVAREIFGDGHGRLAGSINPTGKAVVVPGGFRVSGHWSYGSFIQHSYWTVGNSIVHDGETPRRDDNGAPDIRFMIMPTSTVDIVDNWHVSGLRGTVAATSGCTTFLCPKSTRYPRSPPNPSNRARSTPPP